MSSKYILQAIAKKLLEDGNCPHNPACIFSYGEQCAAGGDKLEGVVGEVMDQIREERYCIPIRPSERGPWPCAEVIIVKFKVPRPDHKEPADHS